MGIFDLPNRHILVIGDPKMTFGGIGVKRFTNDIHNSFVVKTFIFANVCIFDSQMGIFDPLNMQILCHGRSPDDVWGHLEENKLFANFGILDVLGGI